jgi:(+)-trans-carveol dehydrogenase
MGYERFKDKVVFISGIGRGQGRQHAIDFAKEGARVIGFDVLEDIATGHQPMSSADDMAETVRLVEEAGGEIVAEKADSRNFEQVQAALNKGLDAFGRVDVVVCNAGMVSETVPFWEMTDAGWSSVVDTNLTGVWHTAKAAAPTMIEAGNGGNFVLIGSVCSSKGFAATANYTSAKHGLVGMVKVMAIELAEHNIRANVVAPTNVNTQMFVNDICMGLFAPDIENPTVDQFEEAARWMNLLPVGWIEPEDTSNAVRWIASDEARFVTGTLLSVDAGCLTK